MNKIVEERITRLSQQIVLSDKCPLWDSFYEYRLTVLRRNALRHSNVFFESKRKRKKVGRRATDLW